MTSLEVYFEDTISFNVSFLTELAHSASQLAPPPAIAPLSLVRLSHQIRNRLSSYTVFFLDPKTRNLEVLLY